MACVDNGSGREAEKAVDEGADVCGCKLGLFINKASGADCFGFEMDGESDKVIDDGDYRGVVREQGAPCQGYLGNEEREVDGRWEGGNSGDEGREGEAGKQVLGAGSNDIYPADGLAWVFIH
jgi:hypothetical protein